MPIIPTWCPPSREHWELVTFLWQFFPVVRYTIRSNQTISTNTSHVVYIAPMADQVLSYGQDLHDICFQHSGPDRLGYHGGAWLYHTFVHNVQFAEAARH